MSDTNDSGNIRDNKPDAEESYEVGKNKPPVHSRFSSSKQPSGESKRNGWKRKKFKRDMLKEMLSMDYKFKFDSKVKQQLIEAFGEDVLDLNLGQIMSLRIAQKAINQGDTQAFTAIINQTFGFPKQPTELTGKNGSELKMPDVIITSVQPGVPIPESEVDAENEKEED